MLGVGNLSILRLRHTFSEHFLGFFSWFLFMRSISSILVLGSQPGSDRRAREWHYIHYFPLHYLIY
jgi:hypothetical protein